MRYLSDSWHKDMQTQLEKTAIILGYLDKSTFYVLDGKVYSVRMGTVSEFDYFEFRDMLRNESDSALQL